MENQNQLKFFNRGISVPIGILVILSIVLLVGGIFGWQYWMTKKEVKVPEIKIPEKKIVKEETANWKTYRNEEYGFEVKYPENWYQYEQPPLPPSEVYSMTLQNFPKEGYPEDGVVRVVFITIEKESTEEWLDSIKKEGGKIEEININSIKGYEVISPTDYLFTVVAVAKGEYLYQIMAIFRSNAPSEKILFNQMLSTFRFLE